MEKKDEELRQEMLELQMIEERKANRIVLMKEFLSDLEYVNSVRSQVGYDKC